MPTLFIVTAHRDLEGHTCCKVQYIEHFRATWRSQASDLTRQRVNRHTVQYQYWMHSSRMLSLPPARTFVSFHSSPNRRSSPSCLHDRPLFIRSQVALPVAPPNHRSSQDPDIAPIVLAAGRHQKRKRPPLYVACVAHRPLSIAPRSLDTSRFRRILPDMEFLIVRFIISFRFRRSALHSLVSRFGLDLPPGSPPRSSSMSSA